MTDQLVDPRNFTTDDAHGLFLPNAVAMSRNLQRMAEQNFTDHCYRSAIEKIVSFWDRYEVGRMCSTRVSLGIPREVLLMRPPNG